jgi:hypothetical protein
MQIRLILSLMATVALMHIAAHARADWHYSLGRHLGVGWGDGYHSRTACLPRRSVGYAGSQPSTPWWAAPAVETEPLPQPAATQPTGPSHPHTSPGPSLFRQPGEGSSIVVPGGTGTMR